MAVMVFGTRAQASSPLLVVLLLALCQPHCIWAVPSHARLPGFKFRSRGLQQAQPAGRVVAWGDRKYLGKLPDSTQSSITKISAFGAHALALTTSNQVIVWGDNEVGQLLYPQDAVADAQDIAAGFDHSVVLLMNGSVVAFGNNDFNQCQVPAGLRDGSLKVLAIAAGWKWSLALVDGPNGGQVKAWGHNRGGVQQIPPEAQSGVVGISAGVYVGVAVKFDGSIVQWGNQTDLPASLQTQGVLFNNSTGSAKTPAMDTISASWTTVAAVAQDGTLATWRAGFAFEPGFPFLDGSIDQLLTVPSQQPAGGYTKVVARYNFSMALTAGGNVVVWGNDQGSGVLQVPAEAANNVIDITGGSDAVGAHFGLALVQTASASSQPSTITKLNTAPGCQDGSNSTGYSCNRMLVGIPGSWSLSYTVTTSPTPPVNSCTASFQATSANNTLPAGATSWVHVMLASTAPGWIALSFPDTQARMYPAKAIIGYATNSGAFVHTYMFSSYNLPSPDSTSWAYNMGAARNPDGSTIICFSQPAAVGSSSASSGSRRQLRQLNSNNIVTWDLGQEIGLQVASSQSTDLNQRHTVVGSAGFNPSTGAQVMVDLSAAASKGAQASAPAGGSSSSGLSGGAIAGIIIGSLVGATLAILVPLFIIRRQRRRERDHEERVYVLGPETNAGTSVNKPTMVAGPGGVIGLLENDVFLRSAAHNYGWVASDELQTPLMAVQAGVNDHQLDALQKQQQAAAETGMPTPTTPVVHLSKHELRHNIQLLRDGLLGRGATALVFKCAWPSRFGPNALLAAKVVKDGYDGDLRTLESFTYEANVLASVQHRNVVRLYAYCLEPPTLCLILELLPTSLKDVLYKAVPFPTNHTAITYPASKYATLSDSLPSHNTATSSLVTPRAGAADTLTPSLHTTLLTTHADSHAMPSVTATKETTITPSAMPIMISNPTHMAPHAPTHVDAAVKIVMEPETAVISPVKSKGPEEQAGHMGLLPQTGSNNTQQRLNCLQVVRLATDMAAGLAHLHNSELPIEVLDTALSTTLSSSKPSHLLASPTMSHAAVRARIVHRDMKPANILINSQGVAKISDFGLARQHEHTTVATVHLGVGTLPYMAPELLVGAQAGAFGQAVTNRVDIYSLAIMLWEMVAGYPPWKDMGEMAIMAAVSRRQRPPLPGDSPPKDATELREVAFQPASPTAIPQLNAIIRSCWNQRDLRRPQASAVHNMLVELLASMQPSQGAFTGVEQQEPPGGGLPAAGASAASSGF